MEYYYKIYGLNIKSEIELPEAYESQERLGEVEIKHGIMPEFIQNKRELNYYFGVLNKEYKWFSVENVGDFFIEKGTRIIVELCKDADAKLMRSLLLGICFGSILYQRDILCMHGSAVVWKNKAIIISGVSGAGKSTVSTEFRKRGCLFMADDTVAITMEAGSIYANPAYPQQKLCTDSALEFGYDLKELTLLSDEREKYAVRLQETFCPVNMEVGALVCLEITDTDQLLFEEITGSVKLEYIIKNLYTYREYSFNGMNTSEFKRCLEIAQKVHIIRVTRPKNKKVTTKIVEQIIDIIESNNKVKEYEAYGLSS